MISIIGQGPHIAKHTLLFTPSGYPDVISKRLIRLINAVLTSASVVVLSLFFLGVSCSVCPASAVFSHGSWPVTWPLRLLGPNGIKLGGLRQGT